MRHARHLTALTLVLSLLVISTGCATSKAFSEGVPRITAKMDRDVRHYAGADVGRLAEAEAFAAATKDQATIDVSKVEQAWNAVKVWYLPAVDADPLLDADAKAVRHDAADRLDRIIAAEKGRPLRGGP